MLVFVAALLIALDQVTKQWAESTFPLGGPGMPLGLGFNLTYVRNSGAAFGIFQDGTLLLAILSLAVSLGILAYLIVRRHALLPLQRWALTLIFAGAVGNMIDRFLYGYVIDFIHFHMGSFDFPVFNVADSCVVIGAGLMILAGFFSPRPAAHQEKRLADPDFFKQIE
jgi:signal peptidase II